MTGRDNVTPFRPRRPKGSGGGDGLRTPRGQVLLAHGLTVAAFALFLAGAFGVVPGVVDWLALALGVAALAISASKRSEGMPWARTHHEMGVRTLIIGGCAWTIARLAGIIPGASAYVLYVLIAIVAWVALRAFVGLARGVMRLPFPNPTTPFV